MRAEVLQPVTDAYVSRAGTWLLITTLVYFLMNGAQIFETAVIVPKWAASPPESLTMFRGPYRLDFKAFWITLHSIHELTFIIAIAFGWKLEIRSWLLLLFGVHFAVRAWTLLYFAPTIIGLQDIANNGGAVVAELQSRAALWKTLNYLRVALFIGVSLALVPLCVKLLRMK